MVRRLQLHVQLPLIVGAEGYCEMTVGGESRRYADDGTLLLFDDSFLHEVHNRSSTDRVVLLCDLYHPDLSEDDRRRISDTFSPPSASRMAQSEIKSSLISVWSVLANSMNEGAELVPFRSLIPRSIWTEVLVTFVRASGAGNDL